MPTRSQKRPRGAHSAAPAQHVRPLPRSAAAGRRPWAATAVLLASLPLTSCCTLARLFCGPDHSPWVPIAHDTPRATLATFLEAVRRDDPERAYQCLGQQFKQAHGIDGILLNALWERMRAEVPGFHLLGYATLPDAPTREVDGGVTYVVEAEGHQVTIDLVRQSYYEVRYRDATGLVRHPGKVLDGDTLNGRLAVKDAGRDPIDDTPRSRIEVAALTIDHAGTEPLRVEDVDALTIGREWKIADIKLPQ